MSNNLFLYEKMVATRHAEIRRDMELSRKPAHVEQSPTVVENAASRLGALLVEMGSRLQRVEPRREASLS